MEKVEAVPGLDLEVLEVLFARWIHASAEAIRTGGPEVSEAADDFRCELDIALRNAAPALIAAAKREELRNRRESTHAPGCHLWGPRHYECLKREFDAANARIAELESILSLHGYALEQAAKGK